MRRFHYVVTASVWMFALGGGVASPRQVASPKASLDLVVTRLDDLIRTEMKVKSLPAVSIAFVYGKEVRAKGYGIAKPKPEVAATANTVYRVGSVSKLFTDLAVMQLVEKKEIDLDAPVTKYLPEFRPKNSSEKPITFRQLMAHRSGLCRETPVGNYFDSTSPTLEETVRSLNATELVYPPGEKTKYSNAGISVVGRIVEAIKKEPFARYVQRTVIDPMGLKATAFEPTPEMKQSLAQGVMWTYDGRTFDAPTFLLGTSAAGNLYSTVNDLAQFIRVLLDGGKGPGGQVISPETLREMFAPQYAANGAPRLFGIGFNLGMVDGHKRVGHGGAVYGFATEVAALPNDDLGVVVCISKDCANTTASRIADHALRLLLALKAGSPLPFLEPTKAVPAELAKNIEGRYGDGDRAIDITASQGRVYMTPARGGFRLELRLQGKNLIADDPLGFGVTIKQIERGITLDDIELRRKPESKPVPPPSRWLGLIGEYGWDHNTLYILERDGKLFALIEWFFLDPLEEISADVFKFPDRGLYVGETLKFTRDANDRASKVNAANVVFERRKMDGDDGSTFRIQPVRPVAEIRSEAMAAKPPIEQGEFLASDLVDLTAFDPTIKLDIRYATDNNFLGMPFYSSAKAFMQRPASKALLSAHRALKAKGYGLLIHDAYRPWYVTKMFWEATPISGRGFVADPSKGSKHNRGCAVDLTLYDLATGKPLEMVGGYDEFSNRSSPDYPGGTSLQRWQRDTLRHAMEREGFAVNEVEWWHFDFQDWPKYGVQNDAFERIKGQR